MALFQLELHHGSTISYLVLKAPTEAFLPVMDAKLLLLGEGGLVRDIYLAILPTSPYTYLKTGKMNI